jgi:hypothetical protein
VDEQKTANRTRSERDREAVPPPGTVPERTWADDAADARTSDDPRARTPHDSAGQPSGRPFEESRRPEST